MSTRKPTPRKAARKRASSSKTKPWQRANPEEKSGGHSTHLRPAAKAAARRSAKKAGRPYPNLVDNMRAARAQKAKEH